ncbi:MAG TPA: DNA primase [Kineosporiaceae bacterium]|nr:DNA primase [Kineosporiaceae bacterium]
MRIRREDVEHVREQTRIEEVVAEHVTLKPAGVGSLKGLCPFHDERTPSFHVRPQAAHWHCFGCNEGGDVIDFVQKVDHLTFTEAVERLAARMSYVLRYEDESGGRVAPRREQVGQRQRLVEANRVAAQFYAEQLATSPDAMAGRQFLADRGFDRSAAEHFGIGFAPRSGEGLLRHLRGKGFTEAEILASGLAGQGQRGLYDQFRGRVIWPIRDVTGDVVGFGARRLFEDDRIAAKYLNTRETVLFKKPQVLYGIDLAKKEIARNRQVVVVEGYTDVMACHLSGVPTAVATCGTAFGAEHIRIVRRLLGDDSTRGSEVIFTFDGDEAGQKAALRAFEEDQRFVAQTFVAVARDGMDPCDLRLARGEDAVHDLVAGRQPLFEFALRSALRGFDLDTAEGRVQAARATVPIVAKIRDVALRGVYARRVAGWLGLPEEDVLRGVRNALRATATGGTGAGQAGEPGGAAGGGQPDGRPGARTPQDGAGPGPHRGLQPDPRDPVARVEREALECMIQVPQLVPAGDADALPETAFEVPAYRAVQQAVRGAGGIATAVTLTPAAWTAAVRAAAPEAVAQLVSELAVAPLPADSADALARYATSVVLRVAEVQASREIGTLKSRVQRLEADDPGYQQAFTDLLAAEARRRALRERFIGG